MSCDTQYIIQYEGPFGETELLEQLSELNKLDSSYGFRLWGYDTIQGDVKWSADEEIVKIAKKSSVINIISRNDSTGYWEDVYMFKQRKVDKRTIKKLIDKSEKERKRVNKIWDEVKQRNKDKLEVLRKNIITSIQ
jgi:hypothetical protein